MSSRYAFFTYVQEYLEDVPAIDTDFQVSDAMIDEFAAHVRDRGIDFADEDLTANLDYVQRQIEYEVIYNRRGVSEADRVRLQSDPQVLAALEMIPEARDLALRARMAMAGADR
jgi:hypothetical protein